MGKHNYYKTPEAFKHALETRIREASTHLHRDIGRVRQLLIFDRFLARVCNEFKERVIIKGGIVLELRTKQARTTRDIDLHLSGHSKQLLRQLQHAARQEMDDFLTYLVVPDNESPRIRGDGLVYEGYRFRVEAQLAGRQYGMPFGVDVGFADIVTTQPEVIEGTRFLNFIGVEAAKFRVYPRETHIAEKLHAFTLPRKHINSRVKDLPDIAILASIGTLNANVLMKAINETFVFRGTHDVPKSLPEPPSSWEAVYARLAKDDNLRWATLDVVTEAVRSFVDPLLAGARGQWYLDAWKWSEEL